MCCRGGEDGRGVSRPDASVVAAFTASPFPTTFRASPFPTAFTNSSFPSFGGGAAATAAAFTRPSCPVSGVASPASRGRVCRSSPHAQTRSVRARRLRGGTSRVGVGHRSSGDAECRERERVGAFLALWRCLNPRGMGGKRSHRRRSRRHRHRRRRRHRQRHRHRHRRRHLLLLWDWSWLQHRSRWGWERYRHSAR